MKRKQFYYEKINGEFWVRRTKDKELLFIYNTEEQAKKFINQRVKTLKDTSGQKKVKYLNVKVFNKLNNIYKKEVLK